MNGNYKLRQTRCIENLFEFPRQWNLNLKAKSDMQTLINLY